MNTISLLKLAHSNQALRRRFLGVYPADMAMLVRPEYPSCMIVNNDLHTEPGNHWVAFYFTDVGIGEFFDSYGKPPHHYHPEWNVWLSYYSCSWKYNRLCVQPDVSATCGLHALFYLLHRCMGMSMGQIQKLYTSNKCLNDKMVERDLELHTNLDIEIDHMSYIVNQLCNSLKDVSQNKYL